MVDLASPPYLLRFSEGTELVGGCAPAFKKSHLFVRLHGGWRCMHRLDFIAATAVLSAQCQIDGEVKIARRVMWRIRRKAWSKCRGPDQTRVFVGDKNAARGAHHRIVSGHLHDDVEHAAGLWINLTGVDLNRVRREPLCQQFRVRPTAPDGRRAGVYVAGQSERKISRRWFLPCQSFRPTHSADQHGLPKRGVAIRASPEVPSKGQPQYGRCARGPF
jgi:hypothetical protein